MMGERPIRGASSQTPSPSPTNPWNWEAARDNMAQVIIGMGNLSLFLLAIAVGVGLYNLVEYLLGGREE
jgi:hypothetical protein